MNNVADVHAAAIVFIYLWMKFGFPCARYLTYIRYQTLDLFTLCTMGLLLFFETKQQEGIFSVRGRCKEEETNMREKHTHIHTHTHTHVEGE